MPDKYRRFADLAHSEQRDKSWRIVVVERQESGVLVLAPHGGRIEPGTSELAMAIAAEDCSFYSFEGLKTSGNRELHVTSHHFDEPIAIKLASLSSIVIGIHGCSGSNAIYVGGLDVELVQLLTSTFVHAKLPAIADPTKFAATHPHNICNRSSRQCGAQIELTSDLRSAEFRTRIADLVRTAVFVHLHALQRARPHLTSPETL